MKIKPSIKKLILSTAEYIKQRITRIISINRLDYAPRGWKTILSADSPDGWNSPSVVDSEKAKWDVFCEIVKGTGPFGFNHERSDLSETRSIPFHNVHITYGYVLALAAHQKSSLSVLDYGGSLGHYYLIGKALLPEVELIFSCKETSRMAEAGKLLNPNIQWFTDDSCLEKTYDLVMITSSLQYMEHWQNFIRNISKAVGHYLLLTRVPVVEKSDSFVAVQYVYGTQILHGQFNKHELLQAIEKAGFNIVREFVVGDRPYIKNAPEQCELRTWLFRKTK
jgi:putative methyltransferase (TIGR04325 family)